MLHLDFTRFQFSLTSLIAPELRTRSPRMMLRFASLLLAVIALTQAVSIKQENSLSGPFVGGGENLAHWDLTGSAQLEGGHIRLTTDQPDKAGAIWNNAPTLSNNWEYQVLFHIHGKGVYLNGDGMALWYVEDTDMLHGGPVFGSKDYFTGLGVFIDTFENKEEPHLKKHRHPYISAMVNNGSVHYEHDEDGTMTQIGGCHAAVRNLEALTRIAVSYINESLTIYVDNEGLGIWRFCFKAEKVHLPTGYHFGISASTSDSTDNHDVISVLGLNMDPIEKEFVDKSDIIPEVENVVIPKEYLKEFIEQEIQKIEKRELAEEDEEEGDESDDEEDAETTESGKAEAAPQRTSLLRKLIYITGACVLLSIGIRVFKKYNERRKERLQKRLF